MRRKGGVSLLVALVSALTGLPAAAAAPSDPMGSWRTASVAELGARRAGLRVGDMELRIGLSVTESVNGEVVLQSHFILDETGSGATWFGSDLARSVTVENDGGRSVFEHAVTPSGIRLTLENDANGVALQRDISLEIGLEGFEQTARARQLRAAQALANRVQHSLGREH